MSMFDVIDPATERVVTQVQRFGPAEVDAAVARSVRAGDGWRAVAPAKAYWLNPKPVSRSISGE